MTEMAIPHWVDTPDCNDILQIQLAAAISIEVAKWTEPHAVTDYPSITSSFEKKNEIDTPAVLTSRAAINCGWCRVFAERVYERLGKPDGMEIQSDETTHTWLAYNGLYFDAQKPRGVEHPSLLPFYSEI